MSNGMTEIVEHPLVKKARRRVNYIGPRIAGGDDLFIVTYLLAQHDMAPNKTKKLEIRKVIRDFCNEEFCYVNSPI